MFNWTDEFRKHWCEARALSVAAGHTGWSPSRKLEASKFMQKVHSEQRVKGIVAFSITARVANRVRYDNDFPINYSFFAVMSHDLAYFLGYVAGDGGAWSDKKGFNVGSIDGYIIEKFQCLVAPNHKVGKKSYFNKDGIESVESILTISRKDFWSLISSYDVKSPSVFSSGKIPKLFLPDFIRGFLDSDGRVEEEKNKTCYGINVIFYQKSKAYLEALKFLLESWNLRCSEVGAEGEQHYFVLSTNAGLELLSMLYMFKGDLYLRRKYDCYIKVVKSRQLIGKGG